jgi:hypothetical protein
MLLTSRALKRMAEIKLQTIRPFFSKYYRLYVYLEIPEQCLANIFKKLCQQYRIATKSAILFDNSEV